MYIDETNKLFEFNGQLCDVYEFPKIKLVNRGSTFPFYSRPNYPNGYIKITSEVQNTVYIDLGDGSEVYERDFIGDLFLRTSQPIHTYTDGKNDHNVVIWFKNSSKITDLIFLFTEMGGDFPEAISYYNLNNLEVGGTFFNEFPVNFPPSILKTLNFSNATISDIDHVPLWIIKSRIENLRLGRRIILNNSTISNTDKLINVVGLTSINFLNSNKLNDVPPNFKDIPNLKYLAIGGIQEVKSITKNINDCRQITHLSIGYTSHPSFGSTVFAGDSFTDWGYGITGMSNLEALYIGGASSFTTDPIMGLESGMKLKTLYFRGCYNTQARQDAFVTNLYAQIINIASIGTGNTIMRQVRLELCWIAINGIAVRPSGTYQQPQDYIQGESNGNPATPMEMIYVLVKQYRWTVLVNNIALDSTEILAP